MISKLMLLEQVSIGDKKKQMENKNISDNIINKLLQSDPTNKGRTDNDTVGSYTDWIFRIYISTNTLPNFDQLNLSLILYDKYKHKIIDSKAKNINNFATFEEFISFVLSQPFAKTQEIIELNSYDTTYSDNFTIYIPHTQEQATNLGKGTKWCTTSENGQLFDQYLCTGIIFYLIDKSSNNRKYNLFLSLDSNNFCDIPEDEDLLQNAKILEFADQSNNTRFISLYEFCIEFDRSLLPTIKNYLIQTKQFEQMDIGIKKLLNAKTDEELGVQYQQIEPDQLLIIKKENLTPDIILASLSENGKKIYTLNRRKIEIKEEYAQIQSKSSNEQLEYLIRIGYPITNKIIKSQIDKEHRYYQLEALEILISNGIDVGEELTKTTIEHNSHIIWETMYKNISVSESFKKQQIQSGSDPKIFDYESFNMSNGKIQDVKSIESLLEFNKKYTRYSKPLEYYKSLFDSSKCFMVAIRIPELQPITLEIYLKYKNQKSNIYRNSNTQILEGDLKLTSTSTDTIYDLISTKPDTGFELLSTLKSYLTATHEISKFHVETIKFLSQKTMDEINEYYPKVCLDSLDKIRSYNETLIEKQIKTDIMQLQYLINNYVLRYKISDKYYVLSAKSYDDWGKQYTKYGYKLPKQAIIQQIKRNPKSAEYFIDEGYQSTLEIEKWTNEENGIDNQTEILSDQYFAADRIVNKESVRYISKLLGVN